MKIFEIAFLLMCGVQSLFSMEAVPITSYITGDVFCSYCDFQFDQYNRSLDFHKVREGDLIYVHPESLSEFFLCIHPNIKASYILLTHNSDFSIPNMHISNPFLLNADYETNNFIEYLDDDKLIAWFGCNAQEHEHPKLHAIPIGIMNYSMRPENHDVIQKVSRLPLKEDRTILLYANFSKYTYPVERKKVFKLFQDKAYCFFAKSKKFEDYLLDLANSKFVLCPRGVGEDTYRTWESILMGAIPIVRTSALDNMLEGLPVLIVDSWEEISEDLLLQKYKEMKTKNYKMEKAYIPYWLDYIRSCSSLSHPPLEVLE